MIYSLYHSGKSYILIETDNLSFKGFDNMLKFSGNKNSNSLAIAIEPSKIKFYYMSAGDKNTLTTTEYDYKPYIFSAGFYGELTAKAADYLAKNPSVANDTNITVVVPDSGVATDTLLIPTMSRHKLNESLAVAIEGSYRKHADLEVNSFMSMQNKRQTLYSLVIMRKDLLKWITAACNEAKLKPNMVTHSAACTANAVCQLNPKLRASSYMFMDIREEKTNVVFVIKGRAAGYYPLPFGYSILQKKHVVSEDMLFEHSVAELVVLNAKEKAKAKQLTMMQDDTLQGQAEELSQEADSANADANANTNAEQETEEYDEFEEMAEKAALNDTTIKTLPKKVPRKLPKFMLRPDPTTEEETAYENFRIFVKWALNLIRANDKIKLQGALETVYVNMPQNFSHVIDKANEEKDENGITFTYFDIHSEKNSIARNLDAFGALFPATVNTVSVFEDKG